MKAKKSTAHFKRKQQIRQSDIRSQTSSKMLFVECLVLLAGYVASILAKLKISKSIQRYISTIKRRLPLVASIILVCICQVEIRWVILLGNIKSYSIKIKFLLSDSFFKSNIQYCQQRPLSYIIPITQVHQSLSHLIKKLISEDIVQLFAIGSSSLMLTKGYWM